MAQKLSDEQVKAYNQLVESGQHVKARAFLATAVNRDFMIPAARSTKATAVEPGTGAHAESTKPTSSVQPASQPGKPAMGRPAYKMGTGPMMPPVAPAASVEAQPEPAASEPRKKPKAPSQQSGRKPSGYKPGSCKPCFRIFKKKPK